MLIALKQGKTIEFQAEGSFFVSGNQHAIESVLTNLIANAIRAEPKGGRILARVAENGIISIEDHGEGVPFADREMIFEPFWRKSEATPGTGLGLAIAKELTDLHRGRIWVEDTLGGGATFKLSLPTTA